MRSLRIALAVLGIFVSQAAFGAGDRITLYTPPFQGPGALGQSVATFLNLQLWQTLRQEPPKANGRPPTLGVVVWGRQLDVYGHQGAEDRAKEIALLAQLVFWGKVYEYGDGAVALTNLSVPRYEDFRQEHPEMWQIRFRLATRTVDIEADLPQRRYSFRPVVLAKDIIDRYSKSMAIEMRQRSDGGDVIGHIGQEFTREAQNGDMVRIVSGGKRGWVHLPDLSSRRSEAVNFVGGVVRTLRGDWQGVEELMKPVADSLDAPNDLRTDAFLYRGLAQEKQGRRGGTFFATAMARSPSARRCVVYAEMGELAAFARLRAAKAADTDLGTRWYGPELC